MDDARTMQEGDQRKGAADGALVDSLKLEDASTFDRRIIYSDQPKTSSVIRILLRLCLLLIHQQSPI